MKLLVLQLSSPACMRPLASSTRRPIVSRMMLRIPILVILVTSFWTVTVLGGRPSEELLPSSTKAFVAIPNLEQLNAAWNRTQLGQMFNDPAMKPFVEDLQRQLKAKFSQAGVRLGVTPEDLKGIANGEVAVASVQPGDDKARCATVLLADITDRNKEAQTLLAKVGKNLVQKGAVAGETTVGGVKFSSYKLQKKKPTDRQVTAYYALYENCLVAVDDVDTAELIIKHFAGKHTDTLQAVPAFAHSMAHSSKGLKAGPHIRWFIEPFGYVQVARAYQGGRRKRGTDMVKVLSTQGFNAVQGLGGQIAFSTGDHELQHQSFIYAPAAKREAGDASTEKYRLAARMLDFPNTDTLLPQTWIPKRLGTFVTFNWEMQKAFWYAETLVNAIAGDEVFKDVIKSIETDPNGPQINVDREFVKFLGKRATIISDYREPIDTKSERVLLAVEVTDPQSVAATVKKTMEADGSAKPKVVNGHTIWEMTQDEAFAVEPIKIDGADVSEEVQGEEAQEEEKRFRPNAAVTVIHGHLLIATHVDYLEELLTQAPEAQGLSNTADFQRVTAALKQLGANQDSFRLFSRTDHAYRVTYEMIKQNKMPEAESLLGKLLNELFAPDEEDTLRDQQLDGSKLPEFSQLQKYLGPAGMFFRTEDEGWSITGCLLTK